jgi:dTDP-4-dehydrorhamnose reductase
MAVPCKKRKVLVIGGTGRLGRLIVHYLKKAGHDVIYTHHKNGFADSLKFDFFRDDISDFPDFNDFEVVIFAAKVEFEANIQRLENAMKYLTSTCSRTKRFVYVSSDAVFDGEKPGGMYAENDPVCPKNTYGKNLAMCEEIVAFQCFNYCIVRPGCIYGYSMGELDPRLEEARRILISGKFYERFEDMFKSYLSYKRTAEWISKVAMEKFFATGKELHGIVHVSGSRLSIFDFTFKAMKVLGVSTEKLIKNKMPTDNTSLLKDTSLKTEILLKVCNSLGY